ncbi:hypothetical protein [Chryseobacterium hagamense]|nr:hypothetical protein [Chryseobacterium hagamense]
MKNKTKLFLTKFFLSILMISCKQKENDYKRANANSLNITNPNRILDRVQTEKIASDTIDYTEKNEEFISNSLFEQWKGTYILKQEDQLDGWGRESTSLSQLILIKPDSCIFKSWLEDSDGKRYKKNDNYQEFIGGILATASKDSIEFYTKRVVAGSNNSLSPLFALSKNNKNYLIYSLLTSPPHNGIIGMTIIKVK